jgi:hypothetical protein
MPIAHQIAFKRTASDDLDSLGPGTTGDDLFGAICLIPRREESECGRPPWAKSGDETRVIMIGDYWVTFIVVERAGGVKVALVKRILSQNGVKRFIEQEAGRAEQIADEEDEAAEAAESGR